MAKVTLQEARDMYQLYMDCERQLITGQAKHYRIGTREFTALDLDEVRKGQERWGAEVDVLEGRGSSRQARQVVFRDL